MAGLCEVSDLDLSGIAPASRATGGYNGDIAFETVSDQPGLLTHAVNCVENVIKLGGENFGGGCFVKEGEK